MFYDYHFPTMVSLPKRSPVQHPLLDEIPEPMLSRIERQLAVLHTLQALGQAGDDAMRPNHLLDVLVVPEAIIYAEKSRLPQRRGHNAVLNKRKW